VSGAILLGDRWVILDPISAALVSILILKVAAQTSFDSFNELMEVSLGKERQKEILALVAEIPGVNIPHNLKTRKVGNTVAIDMHIKVDKNLSIIKAHDISTRVEDKLKDSFGIDSFISIHVEPLLK
jgi:cation diffusion facilitator family transporter